MDLGIKDRRALVCGGSRGIGRAIAEALSREGVDVAITSRSEELLSETVEAISSESMARTFSVVGDVTKSEDRERILTEIRQEFGGIDILVNNCGGPRSGDFFDLSETDWDEGVARSLLSAVHMTRLVLPEMAEQGWGRILNVTSVSVRQPIDGLIISNSVRPGLTGFVRSIANLFAGKGITANNLCPGYVATDRLRDLAAKRGEALGKTVDEMIEEWAKTCPTGRVAEPDEIGSLAAFLASERASYINGQSVLIDGGRHQGIP